MDIHVELLVSVIKEHAVHNYILIIIKVIIKFVYRLDHHFNNSFHNKDIIINAKMRLN
jgi:hypothetical protein